MTPTKLYASVEEMLAPETLSEVLKTPVKYVRCRPFGGEVGFSISCSAFHKLPARPPGLK